MVAATIRPQNPSGDSVPKGSHSVISSEVAVARKINTSLPPTVTVPAGGSGLGKQVSLIISVPQVAILTPGIRSLRFVPGRGERGAPLPNGNHPHPAGTAHTAIVPHNGT